ncbi:MAG: hypothetical protein H6632_10455 [Anaerolineales bacterium]|nr:hypothetical protein [Anaerolineales bacterium]
MVKKQLAVLLVCNLIVWSLANGLVPLLVATRSEREPLAPQAQPVR